MNSKINKLLLALQLKGYVYVVHKRQCYSKENKRRFNRYTLEHIENKEEKEVNQYFTKQIDLLKYLIDKYKEVST